MELPWQLPTLSQPPVYEMIFRLGVHVAGATTVAVGPKESPIALPPPGRFQLVGSAISSYRSRVCWWGWRPYRRCPRVQSDQLAPARRQVPRRSR